MKNESVIHIIRSDLVIHEAVGSSARFLLEDLESGRTFVFKKREFMIITLLDGISSLETITEMIMVETGVPLSISKVTRFVEHLGQLGLLESNGEQTQDNSMPSAKKRDYTEIRLERWSRLFRFIAKFFFSSPFVYQWLALTVLALIAEVFFWNDLYIQDIRRYFSWPIMPLTLLCIYACLPLILLIHETGHLLAALQFLRRLYPIKIYYWPPRAVVSLTPAAIWSTKNRIPRIIIALAGLYFQLLLLLLLGAIWRYAGQQAAVGLICISFSIPLFGSFLMNILPIYPGLPKRKTDGYFALSYLLDISNLAARIESYRVWKKDNAHPAPVWFMRLTHFQRVGILCSIFVLPWFDLVVLLALFCGASIWLFWPIHTAGLLDIILIISWFISPYSSLLKQRIVSIPKVFRNRQARVVD